LEARAQFAVLQDAGDEQVLVDSRDDIPDPKYITYVDYQNPFALVDGCSGAPHITKLSTNAWVGCGEDIYILECLGKGYIRIECVSADEGRLDNFCCNLASHVPFRKSDTLSRHIY
jgi:ATP-dependent helicase IRC3